MARLVNTAISIGDKQIKQFSTFTLSQELAEHHRFRLVCPAEAIGDLSGALLQSSRPMIGESVIIQIKSTTGEGEVKFAGLVTQVEASRFSGHAGEIIISGFSPTILMEDGLHCRSWEKKALGDIAKDVLQPYPGNVLKADIQPAAGDPLAYSVQYKETGWQYLIRLASCQASWLYYNGQKLVLGSPSSDKINLQFGKDLSQFQAGLGIRPSGFKMKGYNFGNSEVYDSVPDNIASKAGLNDLGKYALQKSSDTYGSNPVQWHNQFLTSKKDLDLQVNTLAMADSTTLVRFSGHSDHPGVSLGAGVSISGNKVFSQSEESIGDYTVVAVHHYLDGQGNYTNEFAAIPASIKVPPVAVIAEPVCESQSALVTDNNDTDGLGRIRVRFFWMGATEKSPWIRMAGPHAGGGKGVFFLPEKDEEVIVGFESGYATRPYVLGTVYNSKAKTSFANDGNDKKVIQTRSGNKIEMNDKDGSLNLTDAKGNGISIDGQGNVTIQGTKGITLKSGDTTVSLDSQGNLTAKGKAVTVTGDDVSATGKKSATLSSGSASFSANGSSNEAGMNGLKCNISGQMEANVNGGAKTTVSAMGKVALQGAIVALN
jgi:uncharacterized protein involved in type VI secretion and phage assembly